MAIRLPLPGSDDGSWGTILNSFLKVAHNDNGTLAAGAVTAASLDAPTQTALAKATSSVQSINAKVPTSGAVTLTAADVGAPTTLATLSDVNASGATTNQVLSYDSGVGKWTAATVTSTAINDASTTGKGIIQLAGDLGGSNDPTAPKLTATTNVNTIISTNTTVAGAAQKSANLSDLGSAPTARTNLGLGTAATISATAGGDLSGTLPAPTVAKVNGVAVTGTAATGNVLTATSSSAATWSAPVAGFSDPTTTKGDLIAHSTATTRLGVGADGTVLAADSTQATGLKWGSYVASSLIDANSGVAGLDSGGKLKTLELPDSVQAIIVESSGTYALRSTVTTSATRPIIWRGADAPQIGSGYAINDVDSWEPIS